MWWIGKPVLHLYCSARGGHAHCDRSSQPEWIPGTSVTVSKRLLKRALLGPLVIERVAGARNRVVLTFDDRPDPEYTARLLGVFQRGGGRGTFFLVGERAAAHPDIVDQLVTDGHEIGNYFWVAPEFERTRLDRAVR